MADTPDALVLLETLPRLLHDDDDDEDDDADDAPSAATDDDEDAAGSCGRASGAGRATGKDSAAGGRSCCCCCCCDEPSTALTTTSRTGRKRPLPAPDMRPRMRWMAPLIRRKREEQLGKAQQTGVQELKLGPNPKIV